MIFGAVLYVFSRWNINNRTRAHTFRKYPLVRRAALKLEDSSKDEAVRDYIPVLKINEKPFSISCMSKKGMC